MAEFDKKVDDYIARSAPFAHEILEHLRELVHQACPEFQETIKWGFPHFEYKGIVCSMAAFKKHCSFGFWKGAIMKDPKNIMTTIGKTSMGSFDRITTLDDLPSQKILIQYIKEAIRLNEQDVKLSVKLSAKKKPTGSSAVVIPVYIKTALRKNKKAETAFEKFSPSHKKEYVEWITEAKTEVTRNKRLATALEWMAEGKPRNWKYVGK